MILACQNINKAFGDHQVLKNASFHVEEYEKTAVIGINGAGKSTLLKIIMGDLPADSGQVIIAKGKTIGYLAQHQDMASSHTIFDELLTVKQGILDLEARMRQAERDMKQAGGEKLQELMDSYARMSHEFEQQNGYAWKSEITGVLKGLGFTEEEFGKQVDTLSGGQKTRVALGNLLLSPPDIILLPEIPYDIKAIKKVIDGRSKAGKPFTILAVAEGAISKKDAKLSKKEYKEKLAKRKYPSIAYELAEQIQKETDKEVRITVPGHTQRGGSPCPYDRVFATRVGAKAAELILEEKYGYMVAMKNGETTKVPLAEVAGKLKTVDPKCSLIKEARMIGISFGDE